MRRLNLALLAPFLLLAFVAAACGNGQPAERPAAEPPADAAPAQRPAAETDAPAVDDEAGEAQPQAERPRTVPPVRGIAEVGYLQPDTKVENNEVITVFQLKNLSNGSIARLQIDEFWWDKNNNPVGGDRGRLNQPLQPGEVAEITLRVRRDPRMFRNSYQFSHANGEVRARVLPSLD